jgi:hypothetical protein
MTALIPPPSLEALVWAFERWDKIPPRAWKDYDRRMKLWQDKVRYGEARDYQDTD